MPKKCHFCRWTLVRRWLDRASRVLWRDWFCPVCHATTSAAELRE